MNCSPNWIGGKAAKGIDSSYSFAVPESFKAPSRFD